MKTKIHLDELDKKIIRFMKHNKVNCVSIDRDSEDPEVDSEKYFSHNGCDICSPGLGNDVYACSGYSPKHKKIFDGFEVCHECLCRIYNGKD